MSDPKTIEVVTQALKKEATMWDEQSHALTRISAVASALTVTTLEAGMFALVADAYEIAQRLVASLCEQGATNTAAIADELLRNAVAYATTETDVTATVEGAY